MTDQPAMTVEQLHGAAALFGAVFAIGVAWDDAFSLSRLVLAGAIGLCMTILFGAAGYYLMRRLAPAETRLVAPLRLVVLLCGAAASYALTATLTTYFS